MKRAILLALTLQLGSSCVAASDFNPLGFYIAGSAGRSDVRTSLPAVESAGEFAQSSTGWKAALGMRPIPLLAAEVEYIDFGHPASSTNLVNPPSSTNPFNFGFHNNVLQRAQSVSA